MSVQRVRCRGMVIGSSRRSCEESGSLVGLGFGG